MDTSVLAPTPSPWFNIDSLGENSLFLGLNYPLMVKGDPAAIGTTLATASIPRTLLWFSTLAITICVMI